MAAPSSHTKSRILIVSLLAAIAAVVIVTAAIASVGASTGPRSEETVEMEAGSSQAGQPSQAADASGESNQAAGKAPVQTPDTASKAESQQDTRDARESSDSETKKKTKTWVKPVYKEVKHPEVGHYETHTKNVKKVRCNCGQLFDTATAWKAHQNAFLAEMRKKDPDYVCTGTHMSTYTTVEEKERVYVVDKPAWTERVLVKKGYWK